MFYALHPLSGFVQRLSCIFACNMMDCESGFLDAVVMQVMSRQAFGLKLERLVCDKVSCLVTYSNAFFFFSSYGNAFESSQTQISSQLSV